TDRRLACLLSLVTTEASMDGTIAPSPPAGTPLHVKTRSGERGFHRARLVLGGQLEPECRPLAARAQLERAAHRPGELAGDRQPEAAARSHPALRPVEALEHPVGLVGRDSRPVVLDRQRPVRDPYANVRAG